METIRNKDIVNKVIKITRELMLSYGVKGWSMDDLAKECRMSKKTFYKIIGNKEELIFRCVLYTKKQNLAQIENFINSDQSYDELLDNFSNTFTQIFAPYIIKNVVQLKSEFPRIGEIIDNMKTSYELLFTKFFKTGNDLGYLVDFIDPESIYYLLSGIVELNLMNCKSSKEFKRKNDLALGVLIKGIRK